jgi:signal transduction histidine kinase/CheY-like chemotaxis protein
MFNRIGHRIIGPVAVAWLLFTVAGMVVRTVVWERFSASLNASKDATRLETSLNKLSTDLQDAEAAQRGYLLTGNTNYVDLFNKAQVLLPGDFNDLAGVAMQERLMQNDLLSLRASTESKVSELQETIRLRHDKSLSAALSVVNAEKSRDTKEKIRKTMLQMRQRRENIFSTAWENTRQSFEMAEELDTVIGWLGVGTGLLALYLVWMSYKQVREQRQLLEEKSRAEKTILEKSAFLANMSHEIRTPMNAILGFGELLASETLTPKQKQYVRSIRNSGEALLQLINDVLDMSKLEAGKVELQLEPTDLRVLCGFLQTMFAQQAMMKSLQLKFESDPNLPHALLVDRLRLRQILVNLIGNAIKFTPSGQIRVGVHWQAQEQDRGRGTLLIDVGDTGVGISPETQAKIFEPFVQVNPQRNEEAQGTGLGLSIVQRLTQMMKGTITLRSAPGEGSLFQLAFPGVAISARLPASDLETAETIVDFNDFKPAIILVADDNQTNRELMTGMFEGTHHQLLLASNGEEALARIRETKPDLVLMDIRMPVLDGRETLRAIRKTEGLELLPLVAVTASSLPDEEKDLRERFNGFIRKPFSRRTLYDELTQFLPKLEKRTTAVESVSPANAKVPAEILPENAAAVRAELRRLHEAVWPGLRDSLAINETLAFAGNLGKIARLISNEPLANYAARLTGYAEMYAVNDLQKCLEEFPALVERVMQEIRS